MSSSQRQGTSLPVSAAELQQRVIKHDTALIAEGCPPHQRPLKVMMTLARELGIQWFISPQGSDVVCTAVNEIYTKLYRVTDLALPPIHIGAFMFRDIFFRMRVPVIFGTASLNPFDWVDDISEVQRRWIASDRDAYGCLNDQFIDLFDFGYGLDDFSKDPSANSDAVNFLSLSRTHLEAAANACVGSVDPYAVAQSSLIAVELILKGAMCAGGRTKDEAEGMRHKLKLLAEAFITIYPRADGVRMKTVCLSFPYLVNHRYERLPLSRVQIGHIVMKAQYVAGEAMRQLSSRDARSALRQEGSPAQVSRVFPE